MVQVLQLYDVYLEPILGFASQKVLADERIALVPPTLVSRGFSVLSGFAQAGEFVAWRVPVGASVVVEGQAPKPLTPRLASLERTDASLRRADQLAEPVLSLLEGLKQGSPADESVPPLGQTAGV